MEYLEKAIACFKGCSAASDLTLPRVSAINRMGLGCSKHWVVNAGSESRVSRVLMPNKNKDILIISLSINLRRFTQDRIIESTDLDRSNTFPLILAIRSTSERCLWGYMTLDRRWQTSVIPPWVTA